MNQYYRIVIVYRPCTVGARTKINRLLFRPLSATILSMDNDRARVGWIFIENNRKFNRGKNDKHVKYLLNLLIVCNLNFIENMNDTDLQ